MFLEEQKTASPLGEAIGEASYLYFYQYKYTAPWFPGNPTL